MGTLGSGCMLFLWAPTRIGSLDLDLPNHYPFQLFWAAPLNRFNPDYLTVDVLLICIRRTNPSEAEQPPRLSTYRERPSVAIFTPKTLSMYTPPNISRDGVKSFVYARVLPVYCVLFLLWSLRSTISRRSRRPPYFLVSTVFLIKGARVSSCASPRKKHVSTTLAYKEITREHCGDLSNDML